MASRRKRKKPETAVTVTPKDVVEVLASKGPLLPFDKKLSPAEQFTLHKEMVLNMGIVSTSTRNVQMMAIGQIYRTMKTNPGTYWDEEQMGRPAPGTVRDLGKELGISHTTVIRGSELEANYEEEEVKRFSLLTNQILREAISIPQPQRNKLLQQMLDMLADGALAAGEGIDMVRNEIAKSAGREPEKEGTEPEGSGSASSTPPITQLRNRATKLMATLNSLSSGVDDDTFMLSSDEVETIEGVKDSLADAVEDIDKIVKTVEKKKK